MKNSGDSYKRKKTGNEMASVLPFVVPLDVIEANIIWLSLVETVPFMNIGLAVI